MKSGIEQHACVYSYVAFLNLRWRKRWQLGG